LEDKGSELSRDFDETLRSVGFLNKENGAERAGGGAVHWRDLIEKQ
jgi:hypothetical protein